MAEGTTKYCGDCGRDRPRSEFGKRSATKCGLQSNCRECQSARCRAWHRDNRAYRAAYHQANKETRLAQARRWHAERREERTAVQRDRYHSNLDGERARTRAYHAANKAEVNARRKEWRAANRNVVSARSLAWRLVHPEYIEEWRRNNREKVRGYGRTRRAIKLGATVGQAPFTDGQLRQRISMFGDTCWICRQAPAEHVEHVKPLSKGGLHVLANLRPACRTCNTRKGSRWPLTAEELAGIAFRSPI